MSQSVKAETKYERSPHKWNLSIMLSVGAVLWGILAFYISTEIKDHSISEQSHPVITGQLKDIRSDQVKNQILKMDDLICNDPNNIYYKQELIELVTTWEKINKPQKFPKELLRCSNGKRVNR